MRESEHARKNPHARVISLGIGDTTEPIPNIITSAMAEVIGGKKNVFSVQPDNCHCLSRGIIGIS